MHARKPGGVTRMGYIIVAATTADEVESRLEALAAETEARVEDAAAEEEQAAAFPGWVP